MIDLTGARTAVQELMGQSCEITFDPLATADDEFDPETGQVTPSEPEDIYEGPCLITPENIQPRHFLQDPTGIEQAHQMYRVRLPFDSPQVPIGAQVTCVASVTDQQLIGRTFRVRDVDLTGFLIWRKLRAELVKTVWDTN